MPAQGSTLAITPDGLIRIAIGNLTLEKPALVLKLPAKVGTEWQHAGQSFRIAAAEEVEVPAGKFKAIRVDSSTIGSPVMTSFWSAFGIGLLQVSSPLSDDQTLLKSFTPGK